MIKALHACLFCFIFSLSYSQNWNQVASIPVVGREAPFSFSLNGNIYVGGGENGGVGNNSFYMFDATTNTWIAKANVPDFMWGSTYFTLNGKGYIISGEDNSSLINSVYQYDPVLDQWNTKTNFPGAARENTFGFAIGDTGYMFGGHLSGQELNELWAYNPTTDTWTQKTSMPSDGRSGPGGFVLNNIAYIGLGEYNSSANYPTDMYAYSPDSDSWRIIAQYPGHVGNGPLGYTIGGKGYLGLANYLDPNTNTVDFYHAIYEYDPVINTWMQTDSFNGSGRSNAICEQVGDTVYIGSGQGPVGSLTDWWVNTSFTTAIKNVYANNVKVYPNPFNEYFVIDLADGTSGTEISISNTLGETILKKTISNPGNSILINRNELNDAEGLLFVTIRSNNATKTFKLVANQ